jgi:hypothetical protein
VSADFDPLLARLDWVAARVLDLRRQVAERHNAARPVSRLPADVLLEIFHLIMSKSALPDSPFEIARDTLAFSQMCRCWRVLALECPTLWTTPIFTWPSPKAGLELMSRACGLPLTVRMVVWKHPIWSAPYRAIGEYRWHNLRALHLRGDQDAILPLLGRPTVLQAPMLETLEIDFQVFASPVVDPNIYAPQLRTLKLTSCLPLPTSGSILSIYTVSNKLTSLEITSSAFPYKVGIHVILQILACTPLLEHVKLSHCCTAGPGQSWPAGPQCVLPHMRKFFMADVFSSILPMVGKLLLPPAASVLLQMDMQGIPPGSERYVIHLIHPGVQRMNTHLHPPLNHLDVVYSTSMLHLSARHRLLEGKGTPFKTDTGMETIVRIIQDPGSWANLNFEAAIMLYANVFATSHTCHLSLFTHHHGAALSRSIICHLLSRTTNLYKLILSENALRSMLHITRRSNLDARSELELPMLEELCLAQVGFLAGEPHVACSTEKDYDPIRCKCSITGLLVEYFRGRNSMGHRPLRLGLHACRLDPQHVKTQTTLLDYTAYCLNDLVASIAIE